MNVARTFQNRPKRAMFEAASWIIALLIMVGWSLMPVGQAVLATLSVKPLSKKIVEQGAENMRLEMQRGLQKHYLNYGVYIPLEDIMFTEHVVKSNSDLGPVVRSVCGNAALVVWIPLLIRLPLVGERSIEWCWKPALKE